MANCIRELSSGPVEIYNEEILGIGSYGKVCKAKCGQLPCAAKLLHDTMFGTNDPGICKFVERFEQECQFLRAIKHPNIVQYLGTIRDPQSRTLAILMELMDESLTRFLEQSTSPLPYHTQLNICHDVALALAYLHSNDIVHRDLSSNNILLIGEGSRAKVTDFGMSKLVGMNPCMTPLTMCPGTAAYMPPEALVTPPRYSSKLDCFSHGVLTIQITTRQFPDPGDAHRCVKDPSYPSGQVLVQVPETERRKKDLELVDPDHPLLPLALHCLKDRDVERPLVDELCRSLASLRCEPKYAQSIQQSREHNTSLQQQLQSARASCEAERDAKLQIQKENEEYEQQLQAMEQAMAESRAKLQTTIENYESTIEQLRRNKKFEVVKPNLKTLHDDCSSRHAAANPLKLTWRVGESAPEDMVSYNGAVVVQGNTVYISKSYSIYSYKVPENKWTRLKPGLYEHFAMAIIEDKLTTIGGCCPNPVNNLLCLSGTSLESKWENLLPPMPTKRARSAAITTQTHLIVAGGEACALRTVEILNFKTLQWSYASCSPRQMQYPSVTLSICGDDLYLSEDNSLFSCSVAELLKSRIPTGADGSSVWTRLADIPAYNSTLVSVRGRYVLAVGGSDPRGAIYCYDKKADSWSAIGDSMPTPRSDTLVAVLPGNELVVVGGERKQNRYTFKSNVTEIAYQDLH